MSQQCHNIAIKVITFWTAKQQQSLPDIGSHPALLQSYSALAGSLGKYCQVFGIGGVLSKMEQWHNARGCKKGPRLRTSSLGGNGFFSLMKAQL